MKCIKCGAENKDGSLYCTNCGTSLDSSRDVKLIKLRCKNCNGEMTIDSNEKQITCPYCGTKQVILDSDAVKIEKEKYKTIKEMQVNQFKAEKEKEEAKTSQEQLSTYKKGKLSKITIFLIVVSFIMILNYFNSSEILKGLLTIIQFGCFLASYLLGMQVIKEKFKNLHIVLILVGCLLFFIPASSNTSSSKKITKLEWPSNELTNKIPKPSLKYGEVDTFSDSLYVDLYKAKESNYNEYVEECKEYGFTIDSSSSSSRYEAYNEDGYELLVTYYESNSEVSIHLRSPKEYSEISWPSSSLASLIPVTPSNTGEVITNSDEELTLVVGNTDTETMQAYIDQCIEAGFNVDYSKSDDYFTGHDSNGNCLVIEKEGFNAMSINVTVSKEKVPTSTPIIESTPTPTIETAEEITSTPESTTVSSDFKATMDSYEAFFDEYIAFMQKYNSTDDTSSLLLDYMNFMSKYVEYMSALDSIDDSELSTADALYYSEVNLRISKKLIEASLN